MKQATVHLKAGREGPVRAGHPWVFSGAVARAEGAEDGGVVEVRDGDGALLGQGTFSSHSQIVVRMWTRLGEALDRSLLSARLDEAVALRRRAGFSFGETDAATTAFRLVHGESDGFPGLVVDAYGAFLVVQLLSVGLERRRDEIMGLLEERLSPRGIFERSDVEVRKKEGLAPRTGTVMGEEPPSRLGVRENGHRFVVDLREGQKTGFYLDQRANRQALAGLLSGWFRDRESEGGDPPQVLNSFSYSGAFGVYAAAALHESRVLHLDSSEEALDLSRENCRLNGLLEHSEHNQVDVFRELRLFRDARRSFDVVILDPPKFAPGKAQVQAACRGYKDLNLLAFKLLRPGGLLLTCSCSGAVSRELFQKVVFDAALDARVNGRIVARLGLGPDHPVSLAFPEGDYLKGLMVAV